MLMGVTFVIIMGVFIKCCAVHTPSSNPKKTPARRFSETLRRPITTLRRMVIYWYFNYYIVLETKSTFLYSDTILRHMYHSPDQVEFQLMDMVRVEVIIMHQEVVHNWNNFGYWFFILIYIYVFELDTLYFFWPLQLHWQQNHN